LRDIHPFKDNLQRENYRLIVRGKTGERDVIIRASAKRWVDRAVERRRKMGAGDNDWFFAMHSGSKIITLADQITEVLKAAGLETNAYGEAYSLYSLRHFYAVQSLRRGKGVFEVARNMGTSVEMLQTYYGKSATASKFATGLGD
jgi:site-specific recombinase XerD